MDLTQLKSGDKIRLQLIQPQFKCGGRKEVTCYYKGIILVRAFNVLIIKFKFNKLWRIESYHFPVNDQFEGFIKEDIKDIKIIKKL